MTLEQDITNWLQSRPNWQQEAVSRILSKKKLEENDFIEIADLCKNEESNRAYAPRDFSFIGSGAPQRRTLRIDSIGEIVGIDNLKPSSPLKFGNGNLTVVFGGNGAGKSGYVRIIKKTLWKRK